MLALENTEMNVKVNVMPPSNNKAKEAAAKQKFKLISSRISKKECRGLVHWTKKHCSLCKKHGAHILL